MTSQSLSCDGSSAAEVVSVGKHVRIFGASARTGIGHMVRMILSALEVGVILYIFLYPIRPGAGTCISQVAIT